MKPSERIAALKEEALKNYGVNIGDGPDEVVGTLRGRLLSGEDMMSAQLDAVVAYLDEQHAVRPDGERDFRRQALMHALKEPHHIFQNAQLALAGITTKIRHGIAWEQDVETVLDEAREKGLI